MIKNYDKITDRDKEVLKEYLLFNIGRKHYFSKLHYAFIKPTDFYRQLKQHGSILYNLVSQSYFVICPIEYKDAMKRMKAAKI